MRTLSTVGRSLVPLCLLAGCAWIAASSSPAIGASAAAVVLSGVATFRRSRKQVVSARHSVAVALADAEARARTDRLTGLPNRDAFVAELEDAVARREAIAVVVIDVNRFKVVNDTLGHRAGDELLVAIASRLRNSVNSRTTVARLGGDEFALIMRPVNGPATIDRALVRAERIAVEVTAQPAMIAGAKVPVEAAFGLAMLEPDQDPVSVLARADAAMYTAKRSGVCAVRVFTPEMEHDNRRELTLSADLCDAFARDQFVAHFQPKFSAATGGIVGVEVLARWRHPVYGLLLPAAFTHLIDVSDKVGRFTTRMLALGLDGAADARLHGMTLPVAVNVSVRALLEPGFVETIIDLCAERRLPPSQLTIELTESELMDSAGMAGFVLRSLAAIGVRVSIDDFGTGYSSFARLPDLPIDEIKIDQSFVRKLHERSGQVLVRAMVDMGSGLGYEVMVEGVECDSELGFLTTLDHQVGVQGYLFDRPMPIGELLTRYAGPPAPMGSWEFAAAA